MHMSIVAGDLRPASNFAGWRTPLVIIVCGCVVALPGFGPRSSLGLCNQKLISALSIPMFALNPAANTGELRNWSASCASCLIG